ncbi:bifunctional pyr operon transcriptional regulator/uracil phosphoribosyltransferase PyrR [Prochlorococcus marinus]|uniref:bifunctional pyr operon transcriptional regulator/uracil phosphoribosyltransferase PyrR n=1 Tax=Prochlorococcus marinus TaxID=1219 RepID=UPI0022B39A77|nr:bifunctional pyr operon transcriptional regulator/uracil phosphoribosyltransferase PyrR [Prochlorococcus marinus]
MPDETVKKEIEILSKKELDRTIKRLASQILEKIPNISSLLLVGIPTRGVYLCKILAKYLEELSGQPVENGCLDPTFHRDDLARVGTRIAQATDLPSSVDDREVVLIDDVIYTGRTIKAALEALHSWGRAKRVTLLAMVDRGNREVPIQPDFCGRVVPTSKDETIDLRLWEVDGEEGIFLCKKL